MTVLYFTDGALIEDLHVRKSLLRIPEIIGCLKENQAEFINCDLFIAMMDQAVFNLLNYHQKSRLKSILQSSLYHRWVKQGVEPDLIIKRKDYNDFSHIAATFEKHGDAAADHASRTREIYEKMTGQKLSKKTY